MQASNQNNMANVAKTQGMNKTKSVISKENQDKILRAYIALYNAFLLKNLMSGMTLGAASHNALQLLHTKIASMDKYNPVTRLLLRIHKYHSAIISKRVMTSKYRDAHAIVRPEDRTKLNATISQKVKYANATLNAMSTMYKPRETMEKAPAKTATKPAQRVPQMLLLIRMKELNEMHQRTA